MLGGDKSDRMTQIKQKEWLEQWERFEDQERWLFEDWIAPVKLEDMRGKYVLDAGCGGGQHTSFVAPYAREIVGVDLNAISVAKERCKSLSNARLVFDRRKVPTKPLRRCEILSWRVVCCMCTKRTSEPSLIK